MTRAALGIGANIGDRLGNIERAARLLRALSNSFFRGGGRPGRVPAGPGGARAVSGGRPGAPAAVAGFNTSFAFGGNNMTLDHGRHGMNATFRPVSGEAQ